jgi:hypothetical protein
MCPTCHSTGVRPLPHLAAAVSCKLHAHDPKCASRLRHRLICSPERCRARLVMMGPPQALAGCAIPKMEREEESEDFSFLTFRCDTLQAGKGGLKR